MPTSKEVKGNVIDKVVNFISPVAGQKRLEARLRTDYLNSVVPLTNGRRSKRNHQSRNQRGEDTINAQDRKYMHSLVRVLSKENPMLKGAIDRMADNIIPADGILPNPTTDNVQWNKDAEEYYTERCKAGNLELTERFDIAQYQKILLIRALSDGDFGTVFTNRRMIQGVEAERVITPAVYRAEEGKTVFQGIRTNTFGAPRTYYIGSRDRYGNVIAKDHRGIQARNMHFSFLTDRIEEYRGTSIFLPVLDHFRDIEDILAYEKFVMKMAACIGVKITPDKDAKTTGLPIPVKSETDKNGTTQQVNELFPGQIYNLGNMGAEDIEVVESNRPGANFENMMVLLARIAGVGIGLPIELILLDFNRGNMASVRAALLEARKTFFSHYGIVKRFSNRHYKWVLDQGIADGDLKPPSEVQKNYWLTDWSEPVWNWLDPLKEIQAEGLAIAYGFKHFEEVAKQRGKDWAVIAEKLGLQQKAFNEANAKIIIGQPGSTILGDDDDDSKPFNKDNDDNQTKV